MLVLELELNWGPRGFSNDFGNISRSRQAIGQNIGA